MGKSLSFLLKQHRFSQNNRSKSFKLTNKRYTAYQLQIRPIGFNTIHRCGRLFQEYCVDKFAQIEPERLTYFRTKDFPEKRSSNRRDLEDAVANDTDLSDVGTRIVLPSSFTGDPRQMWQLYHDAMGIVRYCGKPYLFITLTANPKWAEITNALLPRQTAQDRPDLVARVFQLKLQALLTLINKKNMFDRPVAHVYVAEFQNAVFLMLTFWSFCKHPTSFETQQTTIVSSVLSSQTKHYFLSFTKPLRPVCFMDHVALPIQMHHE